MVAISQSTPGAIGINMATYVGFQTAGIPGGVAATMGIVAPSLIIIILIARFFYHFNEEPLVKDAFSGLRPAVTGLIATAAFKVFTVAVIPWQVFRLSGHLADLIDPVSALIFVVIFGAYLKFQKHPVFYIAAGAVLGILFLQV